MPLQLQREASYRRSLEAVVELAWERIRVELEPILQQWEQEDGRRADALPSAPSIQAALQRAGSAISKLLPSARALALAERVARGADAEQKRAMRAQFREALGIDILKSEPQLRPVAEEFTRRNVALIKDLPQQLLTQVQERMMQALALGSRAEAIRKELVERHGIAENRAALIARDQVGKLVSSLTEARQKKLGITRYRWRTMRDNRVRSHHREREGQEFEWANPPKEDPIDGHPGQPIGCRCYAEPIIEDFEELE